MQKNCKQCGQNFEILSEDLEFLKKISPVFSEKKYLIPEPTFCPDCRQKRRLAFRNEQCLYHRRCDFSNKQIISVYSPEKPFKVYDQDYWWSDKWDPLDFGRDFDFKKSFFDQFKDLQHAVPRISLINKGSENSVYNNWGMNLKNCYLVIVGRDNEDSYYSYWLWRSKDCIDCAFIMDSELLYECVGCSHCYNLKFSQDCVGCSDSAFLHNCSGCKNCLCCVGLKNKEYFIFNEEFSKEKYEEELKKYLPLTSSVLKNLKSKLAKACDKLPVKNYHGYSAENCVGDYMEECKDCFNCFDAEGSQNCSYGECVMKCKDVFDSARSTLSELSYENLSAVNSYNVHFSTMCWFSNDVFYSDGCNYCKNIFGCCGLKNKQYCILNKQCEKEEYEKIVAKIIRHMTQTQEWGEFFPMELSPFAYNETVANDYYPLTKAEVLEKGLGWYEDESEKMYKGPKVEIPEKIDDATEDLCKKILICEETGKPYKIIPQELLFYKKMGLPIPKKCLDVRHKERMKLRNPRKLWDRKCDKCGKIVKSSYAPERAEIVYCEECYLKQAY